MIYVAGVSVAFLLAVVLFAKPGRTVADGVLGAWLLFIGVHLLLFYLNSVTQTFDYPHLLGIEIPFPLAQVPFLYLYTRALTRPADGKRWQTWIHFVLTVLVYAYLTPYFLLPAAEKIDVYRRHGREYQPFMAGLYMLFCAVAIGYVAATGLVLQKHRRAMLATFSNQDKVNLNWLQYVFFGMGLIWLIVLLRGSDELIFTAVSLFVLVLGYYGIRQGSIFSTAPPIAVPATPATAPIITADERVREEMPDPKKYARSGLTDEAATQLHQNLSRLMASEKLYEEPELTLTDLATRLDVPANYLSQVINEREGVNFYDYVSRLRIDAFKQLAADPKNSHFTLLALAFDCGFNSKSTFNRQFKKLTGQLPSEYTSHLTR